MPQGVRNCYESPADSAMAGGATTQGPLGRNAGAVYLSFTQWHGMAWHGMHIHMHMHMHMYMCMYIYITYLLWQGFRFEGNDSNVEHALGGFLNWAMRMQTSVN